MLMYEVIFYVQIFAYEFDFNWILDFQQTLVQVVWNTGSEAGAFPCNCRANMNYIIKVRALHVSDRSVACDTKIGFLDKYLQRFENALGAFYWTSVSCRIMDNIAEQLDSLLHNGNVKCQQNKPGRLLSEY